MLSLFSGPSSACLSVVTDANTLESEIDPVFKLALYLPEPEAPTNGAAQSAHGRYSLRSSIIRFKSESKLLPGNLNFLSFTVSSQFAYMLGAM